MEELRAITYNLMIPFIERGVDVKDYPEYGELTEYEIGVYERTQKQLMEARKKHPGVPICLEPMESEW